MKNKTIGFLFALMAFGVIHAEPKTPEECVRTLLIGISFLQVPKEAVANVVAEARNEALAQGFSDEIIFAELIKQIDGKIVYYQGLINNPTSGYITTAKWVGGTCLLAALSYWYYRDVFCRPQEIRDNLSILGVKEVKIEHSFFRVTARPTEVSWQEVPSYSDIKKMKNLLCRLARLAARRDNSIFTMWATGLISCGCGIVSLDTLVDTFYAKTYLRSCCDFKSDLEQYLATV
jgi:hypothetical protein